MRIRPHFPVFSISNFEDYNSCLHCENNFYIRTLGQHLRSNSFLEQPHGHDFFILLFITQGFGQHHIDSKTYDVQPGSVFFLSPGQVHSWNLAYDIDGYILFFTKEYLLVDFNENKISTLPSFYSQIRQPCLLITQEDLLIIETKLSSILKEYQERNKLYHDVIRLNLRLVLIEMERRYDGDFKNLIGNHHHGANLFKQLEDLIDHHYKDHRPLSFYAEKMCLSLKQLNSLCKKVRSKTLSDLIQERVILEAKRLLMHTHLSIGAISNDLNYLDQSYFSRLFKKVSCTTPEQFRNAVR